jgi:hypothetical protein
MRPIKHIMNAKTKGAEMPNFPCCNNPSLFSQGHAITCHSCHHTVLLWSVVGPMFGLPRRVHTLEVA